MNDDALPLMNTRLQPGREGAWAGEPFQRLVGANETVETVLNFLGRVTTGLKPGVNEIAGSVLTRSKK